MSKFHLCLDDEVNEKDELSINKDYAKRYDNWRRLEELQKLKNKHSNAAENNSDESSSSSEELAVWSAEHEKDFLRTLSALKTHDPKLYSGQKFFTAEDKGDISEDENEKKISKPGYYEEQELIKRELKAAFADQNDDVEPLLRQRIKTENEVKNEEDEYYEWLKGQRNEDLPGVEELRGLKEAWNDMNLDENEKFYVTIYVYTYSSLSDNLLCIFSIPLYEEIVNVEKDEEEVERENEFEQKYNFRYEEPDQDFKLAGDDDLPLNIDDLDADFDPATYDRRMKEIFNSQYYEKVMGESQEKITSSLSDVSTDDSDYDIFEVNKRKEGKVEDINEGYNDGILDPEKKPHRKKRKRNSQEKSFEEYFNEYYALEYEDIIGDGLITKYKYRKVPANDFGITIDELLNADDRQLNAWASIKKLQLIVQKLKNYMISKHTKESIESSEEKRIFSTDFGGNQKLLKAVNRRKQRENSTAEQEKILSLNHLNNECSCEKNHSTFKQFISTVDIDDSRLRAYGINPKKYKNKLFRQQQN
ncbi:hypothetical protein DINM_005077 [Dirofilaria immitis]|nr:hypothetical protein [Dirofilaria immitis]